MNTAPTPKADITVDGTGLLCVTLLLRLLKQREDAPPGAVVHVTASDPAAPLDLPAWCHMVGHDYLGPVLGAPLVCGIQLAAGTRPTRADAPWHPAPTACPRE
ncbi:redox protein, regulator of disulfide bond formation [Streptomyces sp. CC53]|uniref:sulfurtransferase TusA family protein n=1 Tax=Streptomyces sp. CC53 TaxID=1906740 RepID=UPI00091910A8|nr:sulfurtransferase TusA family protein [Streptomyces sp. CC53]OII64336.1 redox protein, regulator of disulfide bond formation [Streptomyces sp. CC53]